MVTSALCSGNTPEEDSETAGREWERPNGNRETVPGCPEYLSMQPSETNSSPKRTKRSRCVCESIFSCGRPQTRPVQSCPGLDITSQKETARPTKAEYVARARLLLAGLRASAALDAGLGFQARPPLPGGHAKRSRTFLWRKDLLAPARADNTPKENHLISPPLDFGF